MWVWAAAHGHMRHAACSIILDAWTLVAPDGHLSCHMQHAIVNDRPACVQVSL